MPNTGSGTVNDNDDSFGDKLGQGENGDDGDAENNINLLENLEIEDNLG
jgi:hypothetical protein